MEHHETHQHALLKEGATMALYVAITLLATLAVAADHEIEGRTLLKVVWGTTIGLAATHWFAFQLAARLVGGGSLHWRDGEMALAQLAGAGTVALLVTVPVVLLGESAEVAAARLVLAGLLGVVGYAVAQANGAGTARASLFAGFTLLAGLTIALVKNLLSGH